MKLKTLVHSAFTNPIMAAGFIISIPALLLAAALVFQYGFGLAPCVLCIYQRWPYAALIILGAIALGLGLRKHTKPSAAIIALCALVFFGESVLAAYHVGVEYHWWKSAFEGCSTGFNAATGGSILAQIEATQAVRCDAVAWSMFGISMAGYNAIIAFGMGVYTLAASIFITRHANGF